jgi:hypothetical protein
MNSDDLDRQLDALFRATRAEQRDTGAIEFGFETRLLARLREERSASIFSWAWKLAPFFAALAIAAGVWCRTPAMRTNAEATVLAEAARDNEERVLMAYMTGQRQ